MLKWKITHLYIFCNDIHKKKAEGPQKVHKMLALNADSDL